MTQNGDFSLESAKEAEKSGTLIEWVQKYLYSEGSNATLAEHLFKANPEFVFLKRFPLKNLIRIIGPEEGMKFNEQREQWESRVISLVDALNSGAVFPPLIVTDIWKNLELSDGSHRHEALIRFGIEEYWTIFLFTKKESSDFIQ